MMNSIVCSYAEYTSDASMPSCETEYKKHSFPRKSFNS